MITGIARLRDPAAIPLSRLLIAFAAALALTLLSGLLTLTGLLPLPLAGLTGLRSLLFRTGLLATRLLPLAAARLLTRLLSLFAGALALWVVASELLGAITRTPTCPFSLTFALTLLTRLPVFGSLAAG